MTSEPIADAIEVAGNALYSSNEKDSRGEIANVVDGLFFIGRALQRLAEAVEGVENALVAGKEEPRR